MAQNLLMLVYEGELHKCYLPQKKKKNIVIGNELSHTVTFPTIHEITYLFWNGESLFLNEQKFSQDEVHNITINNKQMLLYIIAKETEKTYDISNRTTITISNDPHDDIYVSDKLIDLILLRNNITETFSLQVLNGKVFRNYTLVKNEIVTLQPGDQLFVDGTILTFFHNEIKIMSVHKKNVTKLIELTNIEDNFAGDYPDYHRSPRIIYREPTEKQIIAKPSSKPSKPNEQLARTIIPPLVMIVAFGVVSFFQPRGIYIIIMLAMTVTTIVMSIIQYVKSVKEYRIKTKERHKMYHSYLINKRKELYHAVKEQRHALEYHYPNIEQMESMVEEINARIYEKTNFHHDFLTYRMGLGHIDLSFPIEFSEDEFTEEEDELIEEAREVYRQYHSLKNVPITTSLTTGPVGYIGRRNLVLDQLQLLVMQTAMFHSYHELQFITIFPEEEKDIWNWMRWLPHATLKDINVRGFAYHERTRDQVLTSFYQILKSRKQLLDEQTNKSEKMYFSPHYVVLITDEKLILDHIIMEYFNENILDLGVSLIFVQDVMETLPEHVSTVIDIRDSRTGNVILEEGELKNQSFEPDHFPEKFNKELISRVLASLNHLQNLKSSIPESVTFLEMYGYEQVNQFDLTRLWSENETYKTMAVPLGLRGKEDIVYLNLHERAHGPHGLVAGTTGSGKSEIIQSYILSLALHFHPYEVAFLLIDYKGGGMANLFNDLPHLLGTITNLDGAQSMRALASIKAELQKRQRLFGENDVNHINEYQKLYKMGEVEEPMPHLFIISDEFAELKAEQPEFMKELVSTARIGRSLGIHLILATQKPSGVVDDQIWSNSKFKLALKVQDASDSNEILKTPDAAEITLPGRAYLQVGNNEVYELFQSAWSGATYTTDATKEQIIDKTIYAINDLGQYDILTEDLSGLEGQETIEKTKTELEAVIEYIAHYVEDNDIVQLPSPWLPPLEERLFAQDMLERNFETLWNKQKQSLEPAVGFADFPEEQDQRTLHIPVTKEGHVAVFSSPGFGKSTFIQTYVMDLVRVHNPSLLHVYLLDFGTNGLLPLKNLPHVADTFLVDEEEKIGKLIRRLDNEIKERKKKLSDYGVATIDMYEKASRNTVPNIQIVIDNYDAVREASFADELERVLTQIGREGSGIGIYLLISAGRENALRIPLLSNIKTQISLFMIDGMETRSIVGRSEIEIEELPGRGLIKLEEPTLFQTFFPAKGDDALQVIEAIQTEASQMDSIWSGDRPEEIPMMPEGPLEFTRFRENKLVKNTVDEGNIPIGLEFDKVAPISYNPTVHDYLIVISDRKDGLEQQINGLVKSLSLLNEHYDTTLIDTNDEEFVQIGNQLSSYYASTEDILKLKNKLVLTIQNRLNKTVEEQKSIILIKDTKDFVLRADIKDDELSLILTSARSVGIHLIFCGDYSYIGRDYDTAPSQIRRQATIGLMMMKLGEQDIFSQSFIRNEKYPSKFENYYVMDHEFIKIKIPE